MRAVFWQHKRSLPKPPGRVVYTSEASGSPSIPSGFGFQQSRPSPSTGIVYLGTVALTKMSPVFFEVMDRIPARAFVYGHVGEGVEERIREMDAPYRIKLCGHTANPIAALRQAGIFFYPLQPDHYGTGENALCEAMSMGLVPVVLNNEVERLIVGDAGMICQDADSCVSAILRLMNDPSLMRNMSERAIERSRSFSPERSASMFMELWGSMMDEPLQVPQPVPLTQEEGRAKAQPRLVYPSSAVEAPAARRARVRPSMRHNPNGRNQDKDHEAAG
jgi:glycosyltransferase involved in cell wall biosynthesis